MKEIQIADWIEKITGDRAPLKDLREWEPRIVAAYSELLDGYQADIPAILVNGRFDFQAPIANAWELKRVWPGAELVMVDDAGHAADHPGLTHELIRATDRFAVFR